jgi:haloalkane dehalogenase
MTLTREIPPAVAGTPHPAWLDPDLYPFASRYREIDGCRVHYIDEGTGPTFLFLHANPAWSFIYRDIIKGLRDCFRCVALDYPGFGLSTARPGYGYTLQEHAALLDGFVRALDLAGITLMAHDAGGPIGLAVAEHYPERFRALVLADTYAWPVSDFRARMLSGMMRTMGSGFGGFLIRTFNPLIGATVTVGIRRRTLTGAERAAYRGPFADRGTREPQHALFRSALASEAYLANLRDRLPTLAHLPALLLGGELSPTTLAGWPRRLEQYFPHHRTLIIHGAAHFTPEEAPEEIVHAIAEWWPGAVGESKGSHETERRWAATGDE